MVNALDLFRGVAPFVAVAEEKSFRRAATRLGVSPAAVSKAVKTLEAEVGLPLFVRSARAVSLTSEGALFFERCQAAVAAVRGAREVLEPVKKQPEGELTVSLPFVAVPLVARALALLRARYPKLSFRVVVTDQLSRLTEESVDVAVRIGVLTDSRLIAKTLRHTRMLTVASPAYLARHGTPRTAAELEQHLCVALVGANGKPHPWMFASGPRPVPRVMLVDHGPMVMSAALAGVGISQAFDFMLDEPLRQKRLVEVLPADVARGPDVYAVCAPGRRATPRVRAAFDAFAEAFDASTDS